MEFFTAEQSNSFLSQTGAVHDGTLNIQTPQYDGQHEIKH